MRRFRSPTELFEMLQGNWHDGYNTNLQMIQMCKDLGLEQLHRDRVLQSRAVFAVNKYWVVKIPRNPVGYDQNINEINLHEYLEPQDKKYFAPIHRCSTPNLILMRRYNSAKGKGRTRVYKEFVKSVEPFYIKVHGSNSYADIWPQNVGITKSGKMKVIDYGADKIVLSMYREARANNNFKNFGLQEV